MKKFLAFVASVIVGLIVVQVDASPKVARTISDLESMTVAVVKVDEHGMSPSCSGVWVSAGVIATAAHCVDRLGEAKFYATRSDILEANAREKKFPTIRRAEVFKLDVPHDLALLKAADPPAHETAAIARTPSVGDHVRTMGHPLGMWFSYSSGEVSAVREQETADDAESGMMTWIQSTAPISPGSSGCGLFDAKGDLVGIAHAVAIGRGVSGIGFFVAARYVDELLRS